MRITAEINFIQFLGGENACDHGPACLAHNTFYPSVIQGYQYAICKKVLNDGKIILQENLGSRKFSHGWAYHYQNHCRGFIMVSVCLSTLYIAHVCMHAQSCPTLCDPNGLWSARLLCPWNFPGKNPGAGCHFLLQEMFPTQGSNHPCFLCISCIAG